MPDSDTALVCEDSFVDDDCDVVVFDDDDVVELIGRKVVGGGGAHLLGLLQSQGSEQLLKQF